MTNRDLHLGADVHHRFFDHWGEGRVVGHRDKDALGFKVALKWRVRWAEPKQDGTPRETWESASTLRKTPK